MRWRWWEWVEAVVALVAAIILVLIVAQRIVNLYFGPCPTGGLC